VGGWYVHSSYNRDGRDLAEIDKILYYAAKNAIAAIDLRDNSLQILDKKAGLCDVGIRCLGSNPATKMLVICYDNSNIDLYDGKNISNIPDLYNKQITGNKSINKVFCDDNYAYLACGLGIVVVDLKKKVIKDTWFFKRENQVYEVNDVVILNDTVYAATDYGIFLSKRNNQFINNFATWEQITNINSQNNSLFRQFAILNNTVYVLKTDTIVIPSDTIIKPAIYLKNNNLWEEAAIDISDENPDLSCHFIRASSNKLLVGTNMEVQRQQWNSSTGQWEKEMVYSWAWGVMTAVHASEGSTYFISMYGLQKGTTEAYAQHVLISGPAQNPATAMDWKKSKLAVVHNTTDGWAPAWSSANVSILRGADDWTIINRFPFDPYDFFDVCIAPYDTSIIYAASYQQGLFEFRSDTVYKIYDHTNSALGPTSDLTTRVYRMAFDANHNLWINTWTGSDPVAVLTKNGNWQSFSIPFVGEYGVGTIFADSRNWLWVVYGRLKKLALFNPDRSSDVIRSNSSSWKDLNLSLKEEEGAFNYIYTVTETKDGHIWIGTDKGIKIYYTPSRLWNEPHVPPQSIPVQAIRNGDTLIELVLGFEAVRCIAPDGGNRKWVGTESSGVFLLSPDGKTELFHFTKDNSPLPSNYVHNIPIDGETGDVYFGTDKGLASFRYTATDWKENYENLKIFPNPVRENFEGFISISGLKDNSEVKITDAFGKLVYRTVSNGGTAVWDGKRFNGQKASTGVYYVLINDDTEKGDDKVAGKILFIK
jgi:hypothetical protein